MNFKGLITKVLAVGLTLSTITSVGAVATSNSSNTSNGSNTKWEGFTEDVFIRDREITGLVFQSADDASVEIDPEIQAYIKKRTGITLKLEGITEESSSKALAAGLASGDLPDFIAFYLNHSGRPEMQMLLKASNEGMFTDLAPFLKNTKVYSKYFEDGYLPKDTKDNIMFRPDQNGATYLVHMSINRNPAVVNQKYVGGPYIRKDIVEALGIDPTTIDSTEKLYDLLNKIKNGNFKDNNGAPVIPLGPTVWGGHDRDYIYNDLVWSGEQAEKFLKDAEGNVKHDSMTDFPEKRVAFVQKLIAEGLMTPEFYTMEETRAKEGVVNKTFGIVADMHNFVAENAQLNYIPLGPIKRADGSIEETIPYKSGYAGWAIPSTTENPEDIVKFADWLASKEGKFLYFYGLEGRDYDVVNGYPVPKKELVELKEKSPDEAKKRGFRGVGAYWGEHLGYTDIDKMGDFGELNWGDSLKTADNNTAAQKIIEMYKYDEKLAKKKIVDGMSSKAYLKEFDPEGNLEKALNRWDEDIQQAYFAKSPEEVKAILDASRKNLMDNKLKEYCDYLKEKEGKGITIKY